MATLLFTAIGTLVGGPIGGAIGALAGRQVDAAIIGSPRQEGPRLSELTVSTSSYGSPVPRHFGQMRAPGTIIWSTDLVEHRTSSGGGKGKPKVTSYSYSVSFAVALSSRPIRRIGRIWADGKLLRGAAGDLKTGGRLRLHNGHADQKADSFIAASEGASRCPAFRGLAYAVFENLDLSDFGNRIPALTFEIIADTGEVQAQALFDGVLADVEARFPLSGIAGLSGDGPIGDTLALLNPVHPMDCNATADALTLRPARFQPEPIALAEPAVSVKDGDFGGRHGHARTRSSPAYSVPANLRYYDLARDYQPGVQRAPGQPLPGQPRTIELPAAMQAGDARQLIALTARRAGWARDTRAWRCAEIDANVAPGAIVTVPGQPGNWRVREWEWRESGVELLLDRLPPDDLLDGLGADAGRANQAEDQLAAGTTLVAFELPWDGAGSGDTPALFAALSSTGKWWSGTALYVDQGDGLLQPLGRSGRDRSTLGRSLDALAPASSLLFDRTASVTIELVDDDMELADSTARQLAMGANRALLGKEIIQFARATPLGNARWRLSGLLRGRGGTENAISGHAANEAFVLLDGSPLPLDPALVGSVPDALIVAEGRGDTEPVISSIALQGITRRPPAPVHPRGLSAPDGSLVLGWTRRARGAWGWVDGVDSPLQEQAEAYEVTFGPLAAPIARWNVAESSLALAAASVASLRQSLATGAFHVRQRGNFALSEPLFLMRLD